ncbi:MAG TPA: RNA polymerase sigma-70 factor [Bacteroidales bacterium]|nr:RNA polymerase sigma-70 factor [Bacteroidales bacterium]
MADNKHNQDLYFFSRLKLGDEDAFDYLFNYYYPGLVVYADKFLENKHLAEEIVQGVFMKLWQDRRYIEINSSVKSYLFQSVKYKCLDILKHRKIKNEYARKILNDQEPANEVTWDTYVESELYVILIREIEKLPPECQKVFRYSRIRNYTNKEIAEKLGISVKTVENQISKALKVLRIALKEYLK